VSDTASSSDGRPRLLRRLWPELLWAAFAAGNIAAILLLHRQVPIPFHLVWVSLTLLYGARVWPVRTTLGVLIAVCFFTGASLALAISRGTADPDEYAEIPLMAMMFLAMVWHARRRQAALDQVARLAEERRRLLDRQQEFVRDASHELRTPITIARGHAELIRETADDPLVRADLDIVLDELDRLSRTSRRLLLLAAAEHPDFLVRAPVAAADLVMEASGRWSVAAPRSWSFDPGPSVVLVADEARLRAALDVLLENAVDFTEPGQPICLRVLTEGAQVVFEVRDGGRGIEPARLPRLFERFVHSDEGRRTGSGTGLGLATAAAIARAHGGDIEVSSRLGVGSSFRLRVAGRLPDQESPPVGVPGPLSRVRERSGR
jgi:two-component system OmpR family sensor kinase